MYQIEILYYKIHCFVTNRFIGLPELIVTFICFLLNLHLNICNIYTSEIKRESTKK